MKKYICLGILTILILSTLSASSIKTNSNLIINIEKEDIQTNHNDAFIKFFIEGLKEIVDYDETSVIKNTYMVPMRDGINLATDVYLPIFLRKPQGTIFLRTPYDKDDLYELGVLLALAGYPAVIQDIRGTHASEGVFSGYRKCQNDGPDALSWISSRDWSNGKVATVGPSAFGITQYLTAGSNPPELACQGVMVASTNLHKHAVYQGGEFRKQLVEEWLEGVDASYLLEEIFLQENYSLDFWTNVSLDDNWENINVPAIHMGGWYDIFLQGITDGFTGYQHLAGSGAKGKSKLIIGPWTHEGYIRYNQGKLIYPENSRIIVDLVLMFLEMVNYYTNGENNDFENRPTVMYYVMGDVDVIDAPGNEWRYADDWPIEADYTSWFFHENEVLSRDDPSNYNPLPYEYDPTNPVPTLGGQNLEMPPGPYDQTPIENRDDVLIFTSEIFTEPYEATGEIKARLYVSSDCPDTDFTVKISDVYPDGRSMLITDGILRMRNRNGVDHWEFMQPGEIYEIEVDLWSTSYIWNTGHRIRVAVSSSNYPRFLANPNTNDPINANSSFNIANNTLYLDNIYPSCIILPEIEQGQTSTAPSKPKKPSGQRRIKVDKYHKYTTSTTDPDGDRIYILFDWDDGSSSGWLGPFKSGEKVKAYHNWSVNGSYSIRALAKDVNGTKGEWSDPINIKISRNRNVIKIKNVNFFKIFPLLYKILKNAKFLGKLF
jgi:predicted acyl esterase